MRRADATTSIDGLQERAADLGIKGLIPVGRPFLDYVISGLADAGIRDVCLVIGPEHQRVRDYFDGAVELTRIGLHFAIQERPLGTADAVLAAETFADGAHVLALNSDNYYPVHTLRALRELGSAGLAAFERAALVREGNIDAERVARYSVVHIDSRGMLDRIIEKPGPEVMASLADEVFVGMNSWSLPPEIFRACRSITPSTRGELELPAAVQYARDHMGVPFHVLTFRAGVLDLSSRADIPAVSAALRLVEPRL